MLKRFLAGLFIAACLMTGTQSVQALQLTDGLEDAGGSDGAGYDTGQDISQTIGLIIKVVLGFLGVIFLILVIYAGILWMTAAGDPKRVEKAKSILVSSVIGLVIVLAAYSITTFVTDQLEFISTRS